MSSVNTIYVELKKVAARVEDSCVFVNESEWSYACVLGGPRVSQNSVWVPLASLLARRFLFALRKERKSTMLPVVATRKDEGNRYYVFPSFRIYI